MQVLDAFIKKNRLLKNDFLCYVKNKSIGEYQGNP